MPSEPIVPDNRKLERAKLAARIHDEVSNRLSLAARESQRQAREATDEEQREAWIRVNEAITQALRNLHELIEQLLDAREDIAGNRPGEPAVHGPDARDARPGAADEPDRIISPTHGRGLSTEAFLGLLRQDAKDEHDRLSALGFHGTMRVTGTLDRVPDAVTGDEILALLHELCANVNKHCKPKDSVYDLSVHAAGAVVEINEQCMWNASRTDDADLRDANESDGDDTALGGHGLNAHQTVVRQLGGDMVWRSGKRQWNCYARIPV